MKQRITFKPLMLVMLLMGVGSKMHAADESLLSYTVTSASTNGSNLTAGEGFIYFGASKFEQSTISTSGYGYKSDGDNNTKYALLKPSKALQAGDIIKIAAYSTSNNGGLKLCSSTEGTAIVTKTLSAKNTQEDLSFTVESGSYLVGMTDIYVFRGNGVSTYMVSFEITRPENAVIPPAAPVFDPPAGIISAGTTITCINSTDGETVHYTIDGSNPTTSSSVFPSSGISLTESTTLKAAAFDNNNIENVSEVTTAVYTIDQPASAYSWVFSNWDVATYESTVTIDGLTINAASGKAIAIDGSNKSYDGVNYTKRLKLGGSGNTTSRNLCFKIPGNSTVRILAVSGSSGNVRALALNVNGTETTLDTNDDIQVLEYINSTSDDQTVYVYSKNSGINLYAIYVTENNTKTNLTAFEFVLGDVYLHNGNGEGKFINSSEIEYDNDYTKLRLKLIIEPDLAELTNATFTVTSSNSAVISAEGVGVWRADDNRAYVGQFTVNGPGTTTISVTFNGNDDYAEQTITQDFTVFLPTQPVLSYTGENTVTIDGTTYPYIEVKTGGATGMLDLSVTPESYRDQVTYSWEPIIDEEGNMSSSSLITIDENGVVTTANKKGRALVTATINHPYYGNITASYVVKVVISGDNTAFKYGTNILFDYYDGCVYTNPLIHNSGTPTWSISDTNVATINSEGKVSAKKEGTVTVTATVNGYNYQYTLTLKSNPHKYIVKEGLTPTVGQEVTDVSGIKMTYGGFTDNFGMGSSHTYNQPGKGTEMTDAYSAAKTDKNGLQSHNYFFTAGTQDPRYECSTDGYNGNIRGWERIRIKSDYLSKTVPVYGTYYQFEPEVDGMLTVNVLQTGSVLELSQSNSKKHAINTDWKIENGTTDIIDRWNFKCLYLTDERGITIEATSKASHTTYSHPYIYPEVTREVDGQTESMPIEYRDILSLKPHIMGIGLDGTTTYPNYAYSFIYGATYDNDGNEIAGEVSPFKIKKQIATAFGLTTDEPTEQDYIDNLTKDNVIHIMENERHGYWTLSQSNSTYTFPVEAGKTYFLYTDGSKLGFNSFTFMPDAGAITSTLEIDGSDTQAAATTLGEKNNCTVTLNRKLIKDQPNTLMLPFAVSVAKVREVFGANTQVLHVESIDNCIHFVRHHHQMIVAGEPCVIYPSNAENTQWVFENVTVENPNMFGANQYVPVSGGGYTFTGCFEKTDMPAGSYYVSTKKGETLTPNGEKIYIYRVSKDDWMSNTRAFFLKGSSNAGELGNAVVYNALDEGTGSDTDGIRVIQSAENTATSHANGVYSISGQKMNENNLEKGIYIINGRKVVIK